MLGDEEKTVVPDRFVSPEVTDLEISCPTCDNHQVPGEKGDVLCRVRYGSEQFRNVSLRIGGKTEKERKKKKRKERKESFLFKKR